MKDWIIIMAFIAAASSLAAARIALRSCREAAREKNRCILLAIHELDRMEKELDEVRVEKRLLEKLLGVGRAEPSDSDETTNPPDL